MPDEDLLRLGDDAVLLGDDGALRRVADLDKVDVGGTVSTLCLVLDGFSSAPDVGTLDQFVTSLSAVSRTQVGDGAG